MLTRALPNRVKRININIFLAFEILKGRADAISDTLFTHEEPHALHTAPRAGFYFNGDYAAAGLDEVVNFGAALAFFPMPIVKIDRLKTGSAFL